MYTGFFYGTLRDEDVLSAVLRRRVPPQCRERGRLDGYRCVFVKDAWYPTLVPVQGAVAPGILVFGLDEADMASLVRYEGDDYTLAEVEVAGRRHRHRALVFLTRPEVPVSSTPWTLAAWQRRFKGLRMVRGRWQG